MEDLDLTRAADASFWRGKRVLLTGHSGLKGSWLTLWLRRLGAQVTGISLPPLATPNLFTQARIATLCDSRFCDIRDGAAIAGLIRVAKPEIVFHMAAQPLVRAGYREPVETFDTNVMGTVHVLDALRGLDGIRAAVMVTTDKVYRTQEPRRPYREEDPLGGHDPYSASKAACEIVVASYRDALLAQQGVAVASARAGNVIGGGDWSQDRLIPDCVRAWQANETLQVRLPLAVRPWQYVLEPLAGYLTLARKLIDGTAPAGGYNFGPDETDAVPVRDLVELARAAYGSGSARYAENVEGPHEAGWLALDNAKAEALLDVRPRLTLANAIERTMAWYRAQQGGADAHALCEAEIAAYEALP